MANSVDRATSNDRATSTDSAAIALPESLFDQWHSTFVANDDDGDGKLVIGTASQLLRDHQFATQSDYRIGFGTADRLLAAACTEGTVTVTQLVEALSSARIADKADTIREDFDWIDTDHDGVITREELTAYIKQVRTAGDSDDLSETYFQTADSNADGGVTFDEFVAFKAKRRS